MKTLDTYVKLLGKMDYRREAWKTSRPLFTEATMEFDKIEQMDLSLNSMCVYTFEMRSSVWMRDLIFSLRPMEGWALSTRSMPISRDTICLSSEYGESGMGQDGIDNMFDRMEAGESRDQCRDALPLSVSSTYTFTIDYRVLISFCRNMEQLNPRLFQGYCIPMLQVAGIEPEQYDKSSIRTSLE